MVWKEGRRGGGEGGVWGGGAEGGLAKHADDRGTASGRLYNLNAVSEV